MKNIFLYVSGFLIVCLLLIGASFFIPWKLITWGTLQWRNAGSVTVTGQAKTRQTNQIATFIAGASSVKDNKQDATNEVNTKINAIVEAAKSFGIKTEDIQTQYINVYQNQETYYEDNRQKSRPGQWNVSNSVSLILRDVTRASSFTDVLSRAGATNINGPQFSMEETNDIENTLLADAVADARTKADIIAKAAGKMLGSIITVTEGYSNINQPYPMLAAGGEGGGGTMEAGATAIKKTVAVTFELK